MSDIWLCIPLGHGDVSLPPFRFFLLLILLLSLLVMVVVLVLVVMLILASLDAVVVVSFVGIENLAGTNKLPNFCLKVSNAVITLFESALLGIFRDFMLKASNVVSSDAMMLVISSFVFNGFLVFFFGTTG